MWASAMTCTSWPAIMPTLWATIMSRMAYWHTFQLLAASTSWLRWLSTMLSVSLSEPGVCVTLYMQL